MHPTFDTVLHKILNTIGDICYNIIIIIIKKKIDFFFVANKLMCI